MKNYKDYSHDKLINIYNRLKEDYKQEQKNPCDIVDRVYTKLIQDIEKELLRKN